MNSFSDLNLASLVLPPIDPSLGRPLPHQPTPLPAREDLLTANLNALAKTSPAAANAIRAAAERTDIEFILTPEDNAPSATISEFTTAGLVHRALASKKRPLTEATKLTENVDITKNAVIVVRGFALGHHLTALARRLQRNGVIFVFEPDTALLRSVLSRIDLTECFNSTNLLLLTSADESDISAAMNPIESLLAMGVTTLDHPPSLTRIGEKASTFLNTFTRLMRTVQTTIATTMVQTQATIRNLTQNLDHYALGAGIDDLHFAAKGHAAIVVSAGPSLRRNIDLLKDPTVRERVVIIAAQTVLKPLLEKGIRPHFVVALDYHEISRRFYEGLTPEMLKGITLVIEPKVNPAAPSSFPGLVRCVRDDWLDQLLGPQLTRPMGAIRPGATVAHLAYYLARHLGCDPAILIGQDLGFTDGQYYAPNAAIHNVWAAELNEFNTLENFEWQRIMRHRGNLRSRTDTLNRPIYTDEQMEAYLVQFNRDFKLDSDKGLTTIDATEGGVSKLHTITLPLSSALSTYAGSKPLPSLFTTPTTPPPRDHARAEKILRRLHTLSHDSARVGEISRQGLKLLQQMLDQHDDQATVNRLIEKAQQLAQSVKVIEPAYSTVQRLNQTGAFNRTRADRAIITETDLTPLQRQRRQIERDIANLQRLIDCADVMRRTLDNAATALRTGEKLFRDPVVAQSAPQSSSPSSTFSADNAAAALPTSLAAVVVFRHQTNGLGLPALPPTSTLPSLNLTPLELTLTRLLQTALTGPILIASDNEPLARQAAGHLASHPRIRFTTFPRRVERYSPNVRNAARSLARHSWRGGLGNLTVYDELIDPALLHQTLTTNNLEAAVVLASDWCFFDPALTNDIARRYLEDPPAHRFSFSQAGPGLAPCVIDATLAGNLAKATATAGIHASLGGTLSYIPVVPMSDLITRPMCVQVDPIVRDLPLRAIADDPHHTAALLSAITSAGLDPITASASQISRALTDAITQNRLIPDAPEHLRLIINPFDTDRPDILPAGEALSRDTAAQIIESFASSSRPGALTIHDPLGDHPATLELLKLARSKNIPLIHLRSQFALGSLEATTLIPDAADPAQPLADVISFDIVSDDAETYAKLSPRAGLSGHATSRRRLAELINRRRETPADLNAGIPLPWICPRLTRRDEVYSHVEAVVDSCIMLTGWCVLDPLRAPIPGSRIEPFPLPTLANLRNRLTTLTVDASKLRDLPPSSALSTLWQRHLASGATA